MRKLIALCAVVACFSYPSLRAQDDLPPPPKPPKSLKLPPEKVEEPPAEKVAPGTPAPRRERALRDGVRRPIRVRVIAPFVRVHVDLNGDERAKGVAPIDVDVNAAGGGMADENAWRYRWHEGRWWYWTPEKRWLMWDRDRWFEYSDEPARNGAIRLGTPERGGVRLRIGDLPELNLGF